MKKAVLISFCLIFICTFSANAEPEAVMPPSLHANAAALLDQSTGVLLYGVGADKEIQPAGLTKIVTALAAIEAESLDETAEVTSDSLFAVKTGTETCGLVAGETLSVMDLVHAILLHNANDAATAIAFHMDSDEEAFANRMNEIARQAGATHTSFLNCRGDAESGQYTTAEDMARITRYAMENPIFAEIVAKETYRIAPTNKYSQIRYLSNDNRLINHYKILPGENYYLIDANGVKASHSGSMGYSLSGALQANGRKLIVVVSGDRSLRALYEDAHALFSHGLEDFESISLAKTGDIVDDLPLNFAGSQRRMLLLAGNHLRVLLPNDYDEALLSRTENYKKELYATVQKGEVIGQIDYYYDGQLLGTIDAAAEREAKFSLFAFLWQGGAWLLSQWWFKLTLLVLLFWILMLFYQWRQKQKRKLRLIKGTKNQRKR